MPPVLVGSVAIIVLVALLFLEMPIAISMGLVGFLGIWYMEGWDMALVGLQTISWSGLKNYVLSCIPFFVLMGVAAGTSGIVGNLYGTANKWVKQLPGGLAMSTQLATTAFGAICGHSMATAATMGSIAYPEMRHFNYSKKLAAASIAAGGSIASLIPPSIPMVIIGMLTELSIGKLLLAGFLPGILIMVSYMFLIYLLAKFRPGLAPPTSSSTWKERLISIKDIWEAGVLFIVVIAGIYSGIFTPTEAAGIGALIAIILLALRGKFNRRNLISIFDETGKVVCALLPILIGVFILNHFIVLTRLPMLLADMIVPLNLSKYVLLMVIAFLYLFLGCFIEPIAIWLLSIPVLYPIIQSTGIDGIWFAVIAVRASEIGLITPPVGMNVFVIKAVVKDVPMSEIFSGIVPFLMVDILTLAMLIFIPEISLIIPSLMS